MRELNDEMPPWHSEAAAPAVEISTLSAFDVDKWWIVDTGCKRDLVKKSKAMCLPSHIEAALNVSLSTGGGTINSDKQLKCAMHMGDFIARIKAYLMSNSPSVMSVGARVCVFGFIFVWFPGFSPGLITPNGLVIALNEHNYIPYISARVVLDAMRNPDGASRKVGVEVCHGELRLCDKILVGDLAFVKRDKHEEVAMPATEGASSSSTARWIEEPNEDAPAQVVRPWFTL